MQYIISIVAAILTFGLMLLFNKKIKKEKTKTILNKYLFPILLVVVLLVRMFSYQPVIIKNIGLSTSPLDSKFLTVVSLLAIWFNYAAVILVISRAFFYFKTLRNIVRFFTTSVFLINICLLSPIITLLQGTANFTVLSVLLPIEIGLGLGMSAFYWLSDYKDKLTTKEVFKMIGIIALLLIPSMPSYFFQFVFGEVRAALVIKELTFEHRIFIYGAFAIPVVLYFTLRKQAVDVIRFSLIYISVSTLIVFMVNYDYTTLSSPWDWPFHLCNTALFILVICLIFKMKRLFYFTYFINVVGALLAMLMPNYEALTNLFAMRIINFWSNHYIAFFLPLLAVALGEFKRPKMRQFIYSMIGFLGYFILVLFLNVYFTALGHKVDYFFINSNFVADKLGTWAENLFNMNLVLNVGGYDLMFHPLYQIAYFFAYVGIGFAVWFVYEEAYRVSDSFDDLLARIHVIKQDEIALKSTLNGRSLDVPMNELAGINYQLKHFSKKYGSNKFYSVHDANLEVHGGEIFGFLGPNGAGKSTIIKSTVGIQPITEGNIEICGFDVAHQPVGAKSQIGYVPDHYALYEKLTGREYINYIADIYNVSQEDRNARMEKYIRLFELEGAIDNKIDSYSHGMKQKITIMSALIHNPKVWILDEPLTGLDPNSIFQVKECMRQHAAEGNIVFFSSHIIDIVEKLCQRIAIIKKGQILCVKTVKEIEESGVTLEEFYLETISDKEEKHE